MYSFADIKRGFENPELIKRELNRLYHTQGQNRSYNTAGVNVFEEDWDTLIILDACRYDVFEDVIDIDGTLQSRISRGSTSPEWVTGNFQDKDLYDTVYVSANLWYSRIEDDINADVYDLIKTGTDTIPTGLNPAAEDVMRRGMHPKTVTDCAVEAIEKHPDKRIVVHYMQPHQPYIGTTGNRHFEPDGKTIERFATGNHPASTNILQKAYRENLELVLDYIPELLDQREDKTVITADHGEMLGDRHFPIPFRDYGHPGGVYIKPLVKVPWLIIEDESRPDIIYEEPTERTFRGDQAEVESQLRDLGYLD
jgi:hypothetical protein